MQENEETQLAATCSRCGKLRILQVNGQYSQTPNGDNNLEEPIKVLLASCESRADVALFYRYLEQVAGNEWDWSEPKLLWPSKGPTALPSEVPHRVSTAFDEAQRCLSLGMTTPAAIMARKSIELACAEQGYHERALQDSIKRMVKDGKLEARLAEWADALREVGNEGAHRAPPPRKQDVSDVLMFARALFEYIYVLNVAFEKFTNRRKGIPTDA